MLCWEVKENSFEVQKYQRQCGKQRENIGENIDVLFNINTHHFPQRWNVYASSIERCFWSREMLCKIFCYIFCEADTVLV